MNKYNVVETIEPSGNIDKDITNLVDTLFSKCSSFYDCVLCNLEPHKGELVFAPAFHYRSDPTKSERYECRILYTDGNIKSGSFSKLLYEIYVGKLVDGRLYYIDGNPNNFYPKNMSMFHWTHFLLIHRIHLIGKRKSVKPDFTKMVEYIDEKLCA